LVGFWVWLGLGGGGKDYRRIKRLGDGGEGGLEGKRRKGRG